MAFQRYGFFLALILFGAEFGESWRYNRCNRLALSGCFANVLETNAPALSDRLDMTKLTERTCVPVYELGECFEMTQGCSHSQIDAVTSELSKMFGRSTNVLQPLFMLRHVCSQVAQLKMQMPGVRQCLAENRIGATIRSVAEHLSVSYVNKATVNEADMVCAQLQQRVAEYNLSLGTLCDGVARSLMCHTMKSWIDGLYVHECTIQCN